jgi:hypothetical protein
MVREPAGWIDRARAEPVSNDYGLASTANGVACCVWVRRTARPCAWSGSWRTNSAVSTGVAFGGPAPSFAHAVLRQAAMQAPPMLPGGLDTWHAGLGKVLSVESDDARLSVISPKHGPLEAELLTLAEQ